jgi:hypothetical protein
MAERKLDWQKLLDEALTAPGNLGNVYSRFHDYSITNMMLFMMQGIREPVASASRWKQLGRPVTDWKARKEVIVPVFAKEPPPPEDEPIEEKRERVARLIGFKAVRAVFPLSATDGPMLEPQLTPGWDLQTALTKLGVREVPFHQIDGNMQGWSKGLEMGINPVAVNRNKTVMHELGHIVLGHTLPEHHAEYVLHRGVSEFQAEAAAYLVMNELELLDDETAGHSRGYIRHWLGEEQPPDKAIQQVFRAADAILRAGRIEPTAAITAATPTN